MGKKLFFRSARIFRSKFSRLQTEIQDNDRFSRFGFWSFLVSIVIFCFCWSPLPAMSYETLMNLFMDLRFRTLNESIYIAGGAFAVLLGMVGLLRRSWWSKGFSICGIFIGFKFILVWSPGLDLIIWEIYFWGAYILILPADIAYELAGHDPFNGAYILSFFHLLFWICFRRIIMKKFREYSSKVRAGMKAYSKAYANS